MVINLKFNIQNSWIFLILFFSIASYLALLLSIHNSILDSDLYYHLAVANLYSQIGKIQSLPWGNDWIFKSGFGDTHLLFHQLLRLHNYIPIKVLIGMLASINVILFISIYKLKTYSQIFGYTIFFLFGSYTFTGRFLFAKGLLLFLPIFMLYYYYNKKKAYSILFILSFLAVWTYPLAPLILVYSLVNFIVDFLSSDPKRIFWKSFSITLLGFLFGLCIHPSFPFQFKIFYLEWFLQIFKPQGLEKIAEWAQPSLHLFINSFLILIMLGVKYYRDSDKSLAWVFFIGIISSYFTTKSIEWACPIGLMWIASSQDFRKLLDNRKMIQLYLPIIFLGTFLLGKGVKTQLEMNSPGKREFSSLICRKLPENSKIFLKWENFQEFVYECPSKVYSFGMNPLYSFANDKERYSLIQSFWYNKQKDNSDIPIYLGYSVAIVFLASDGKEIINNLMNNPRWELKYIFDHALVFISKSSEDKIQDRNINIINKNFILPK